MLSKNEHLNNLKNTRKYKYKYQLKYYRSIKKKI